MTSSEPSRVERLHRAVANDRRRIVLGYLRQRSDGAVSLETIIEQIREQEADPPDEHQLAIDLYHKQLPLLADAGLVTFDSENLTVRYGPKRDIARRAQYRSEPVQASTAEE